MNYMKTLSIIIFALLMAISFAEDSSKRAYPGQESHDQKNRLHETKSTKAYKKAKEACVESSKGQLKGKKLTECIVNYQKEAK